MRFRKDAKLDSSQVEDYRGRGGGLPGGIPMKLGGGGGIVVLLVVLAFVFLGGGGGLGDLGSLAGQTVGTGAPPGDLAQECQTGADANEREDCRILASINSIQAYWTKAFRGYEPTATRLFDGSIQTGCGGASSAVGPFYCPNDRYVYIDLGFFDQLQSQLGARGGPLAEAYILAHEYGHHVQNLTGVLRSADRDTGPQGGQVRVELQADCYAGLWVGQRARDGLHRGPDAAGRRRGARRRRLGRRRPHSGAHAGPGRTRVVDARLRGAAPELVRPRHRGLRPAELRHLQGSRLVRRQRSEGGGAVSVRPVLDRLSSPRDCATPSGRR